MGDSGLLQARARRKDAARRVRAAFDGSQTLRLDGCSSWIFANVDSRGYYRTSYDADEPAGARRGGAERPTDAARADHAARGSLDAGWARRARTSPTILSLVESAGEDRAQPAIATALWRINYISDWLVDERSGRRFERWVRRPFRPLMDRLGWTPRTGETDDVQSLRSAVIFTMGNAGRDPEVLREARRLAGLHVTDAAPAAPEPRRRGAAAAAIDGDAALYDRYLARMAGSARIPGEQLQYLAALAFFTDPALRKRTLAYATSSNIRTQDAPTLIRLLMQRPVGACGHMGASQEQLGNASRDRSGSSRAFQQSSGRLQHFCDSRARETTSSRFFSAASASPATDAHAAQSLETIDALHRRTRRSAQAKEPGGRFLERRRAQNSYPIPVHSPSLAHCYPARDRSAHRRNSATAVLFPR